MLRLKSEPEDEIYDDDLLPEASDRLSSVDVFPDDGLDAEEGGDEGVLSPLPGPIIAAATFIPTFMAVFFGLSYVLGAAGPTAGTAGRQMSDLRQSIPSRSDTLRDPFAPPAVRDTPAAEAPAPPADPRSDAKTEPRSEPREVARPNEAREPSRGEPPGSRGEDSARSSFESSGPSLPPQSRPATPPSPQPRVARPAEAPRQPQAAVLTTPPDPPRTAEARRTEGGDWTPAAAFADRDAAGRLASSIQQQGYPVEVRQDRGSSRPWVVWIGAQPRSGERRR
jgi:hypothetical protein